MAEPQTTDPMVSAFASMPATAVDPAVSSTTAGQKPQTAAPHDPMEDAFNQIGQQGIDPKTPPPNIELGNGARISHGLNTIAEVAQHQAQATLDNWKGVAKGAGETAHTIGRVINAATGDNVRWLPTSFDQPKSLESSNLDESMGKMGETIAEFALGDEVLKGMSIAEKLGIAHKITEFAEKSPFLAKLLNLGLDVARGGTAGAVSGGLHDGAQGAEVGAAAGAGGEIVGAGIGAAYKGIKGMINPESAATAKEAARAIVKEIRPPAAEINNTAEAIEHEMGNIHDYAVDNNLPLNTHHDLAEAAQGAADEARKVYTDKILDPVRDRVVPVAGADFRGVSVGETNNNATLGEIDKRIGTINKELRGAYSKTTAGKTGTALVSDADLMAERSKLTDILHNELSAKTGIPKEEISGLRQRFGRQYTIADNAKAAANQLDIVDTDLRRSGSLPTGKASLGQAAANYIRGGQPAIAGRGLRKAIVLGEDVIPRTPYPELNPPSPAPFPRKSTVPESEGTVVPSILDREGPAEFPAGQQITRKISDIAPKVEPKSSRPLPAWKVAAQEELKNAPAFNGTKIGQTAESNGDKWTWNGKAWRKL